MTSVGFPARRRPLEDEPELRRRGRRWRPDLKKTSCSAGRRQRNDGFSFSQHKLRPTHLLQPATETTGRRTSPRLLLNKSDRVKESEQDGKCMKEENKRNFWIDFDFYCCETPLKIESNGSVRVKQRSTSSFCMLFFVLTACHMTTLN